MTLIFKANDATEPGCYRPVSLINQDAKILTRVLVRKMNTFIDKYVKRDMCVFIGGRQMLDLIWRDMNIQ